MTASNLNLLLGRYTGVGTLTPAMDCKDIKRGGLETWLMAVKPGMGCWHGWQLQTLVGNSLFGNCDENADFLLSLCESASTFSISGEISRVFLDINESTINEGLCMLARVLTMEHWGDGCQQLA